MPSGNCPATLETSRSLAESIICFAGGTLIRTPLGERRIESLSTGDLVVTIDRGPQPIRWMGGKTVRATGALAPIRIARGTMGNDRDLLVSPQHRLLLRRAGGDEALAPAIALLDDFRITVAFGGMVTYHHMMFDQHEVVFANGAPSESFHPGGQVLDTLDARSREELFRPFPALRSDLGTYGPPSRTCLATEDARELARA